VPIVPTKRLASFAFFAALVAAVAGFVPAARVPMLVLDGILLLGAIVDVLALRGPALEVERHVADIFSVGRANLVTITLRNPSSRAVSGIVSDDPIEAATRTGIPATFELAPQGTAVIKYEITPTRRGGRTFDAVGLRRNGPLGLVVRQEKVSLPAEVDVYPDVHAARANELLRRQGRADISMGSRRVRGGDTEFERLRPYARGDEIRHVDWRATARRDDVTVRQFQAESNQNVMFAIDVGRGMRGESSGLTSVDHALNAALLAADVALRGGDKAGFFAFDDVPRAFLPPTGGRAGGRKLTRAVHDLEAGIAATDVPAEPGARALALGRVHAFSRRAIGDRVRFVVATAAHAPPPAVRADARSRRRSVGEPPRDDRARPVRARRRRGDAGRARCAHPLAAQLGRAGARRAPLRGHAVAGRELPRDQGAAVALE
jgi:uncharacterized protein (DUF58 family)